jgi:DNA polymerase-3 subunit epsilon
MEILKKIIACAKGLFKRTDGSKKPIKVLYIDCETGGTNYKRNALLQIAAIAEINGEVKGEIDLKMRPLEGKTVEDGAIETHGYTREGIEGFDDPIDCYRKFNAFLNKHGGAPDKYNRYIIVGYNADFDIRFVNQWYQDISGKPFAFWKHLQFSPVDILPILRTLRYVGILDTENTKLKTMCNYFGIEINAHDAMSDITATRELTLKLLRLLKSGWTKGIENELELMKDNDENNDN